MAQPVGPGGGSSLPIDRDELVATCCSGIIGNPGSNATLDLDGYVVALVDVRDSLPEYVAEPIGSRHWLAPMFHIIPKK